ncbi:FIVAR domain-containing protein [Mycoplasma tullyi]|uniref:FIVAR domain-containing protein n=1 Tax=Mycoplasma tullyi TaxID=1612150 RepID=A0A7D7XW12_9MOLU|nr:FIVAR domain-containing protein [Mycoplasma tullyi]QMT98253.1 FIVAR domain-containing protein [Mycoplasma tullyi]
MKRKNILKFISLLGIGSFVMLAAASCSQASSPTQNPSSRTEPGGTMMGMSGSNANTNSNQGMMNNADQELRSARNQLTTLVDSEAENTALYADYAKIQVTLKNAFTTAKAVLGKTDSTAQSLKDAKSTLDEAIATAEKTKTDFDAANTDLVTEYNSLKKSLAEEATILDTVKEENYEAIKDNIVKLYTLAKPIVHATLIPVEGSSPELNKVKEVSMPLATAIARNTPWKQNADNLVKSFVKQTLLKKDLTGVTNTNDMVQPGNYSFVGYSVDVPNVNWAFAQRVVWTAPDSNPTVTPITTTEENSIPLSDVSWIYNLNNAGAKYTLSFRYFGASPTAYLYFPYKLVKNDDASNVALQYKLNGGEAKAIDFKQAAGAQSTGGGEEESKEKEEEKEADGSSEGAANPAMPVTASMIEAPTVSDIKIAKIALSNLKFNLNTIEFSVPEMNGETMMKVAPMIGNMYITSSDDETNKKLIYDSIFGNIQSQKDSQSSVTVDLLKGYSLATSSNTYIRQFMHLDTDNKPIYLVGLIGGQQPRFSGNTQNRQSQFPNNMTNPNQTNISRTFTVYVNAPQDGSYYISGQYLNGSMTARNLKLSTGTIGTGSSTSEVTVTGLKSKDWNTLGSFDTKMSTTTVMNGSNSQMQKTITLKQGLNKITINGVPGVAAGDAPFLGNLTFTLMNATNNPSADNNVQQGQ